MKIYTLAITCINILLFHTTINQSVVAQTSSQITKMRALGVPIVLPSHIPSGFRLTSFSLDLPHDVPLHSYQAVYAGSNNCKFDIEGSDGGIGDVSPIRQWIVKTHIPPFRERSKELK